MHEYPPGVENDPSRPDGRHGTRWDSADHAYSYAGFNDQTVRKGLRKVLNTILDNLEHGIASQTFFWFEGNHVFDTGFDTI